MEREAALELLEQTHSFPCPFVFRVVLRPGGVGAVRDALDQALPRGKVQTVRERASRKGSYLSAHLEVRVRSAEEVLRGYAAIREVEAVITTL